MNYRKKTLLCTFANEDNIRETLKMLKSAYNIVNNKIIVLCDEINTNKMYCIYNIYEDNQIDRLKNTILLHRKRETNTLYTINSLNKLILELNNGNLDSAYKIEWSTIKNSLLLTKNNELLKINTKLAFIDKCDNN